LEEEEEEAALIYALTTLPLAFFLIRGGGRAK
jgi:hypothetical protein